MLPPRRDARATSRVVVRHEFVQDDLKGPKLHSGEVGLPKLGVEVVENVGCCGQELESLGRASFVSDAAVPPN